MKRITQLFFLLLMVSCYAQDFKPYKVKSGKIVYQKLKYSTHFGFSIVNGVKTNYKKQVPYVSEITNYYWDEYGDKSFEETYKIADFGGEPLVDSIKVGEQLWIGNHRYYFNFKENKTYDDPYYLRIKCRENFQYYQITGSWIKTQYMGAEESGTKEILGKEATYYKIDNSTDLYAWKGLVLKNEDFYTNRKGDQRLGINRTKVAVKIDTISKMNANIFNPVWLKREKLYQLLDKNKIEEILNKRSNLLKRLKNKKGIKIRKNDILLFVTTNFRLGKLQVLNIDTKNRLNIKFKWYYNNNSEGSNRDSYTIKNNSLVDIDAVATAEEKTEKIDFRWVKRDKPYLFPINNVKIYLLKSSRTNKF
ncbi:hypothetical protein [Lutibacter sp.]